MISNKNNITSSSKIPILISSIMILMIAMILVPRQSNAIDRRVLEYFSDDDEIPCIITQDNYSIAIKCDEQVRFSSTDLDDADNEAICYSDISSDEFRIDKSYIPEATKTLILAIAYGNRTWFSRIDINRTRVTDNLCDSPTITRTKKSNGNVSCNSMNISCPGNIYGNRNDAEGNMFSDRGKTSGSNVTTDDITIGIDEKDSWKDNHSGDGAVAGKEEGQSPSSTISITKDFPGYSRPNEKQSGNRNGIIVASIIVSVVITIISLMIATALITGHWTRSHRTYKPK